MRKPPTNREFVSEPKVVRFFQYAGFFVEILETYGIFTAEIHDPRPGRVPVVSWSLNTFKPETIQDAIKGAKHIIDHPPRS